MSYTINLETFLIGLYNNFQLNKEILLNLELHNYNKCMTSNYLMTICIYFTCSYEGFNKLLYCTCHLIVV